MNDFITGLDAYAKVCEDYEKIKKLWLLHGLTTISDDFCSEYLVDGEIVYKKRCKELYEKYRLVVSDKVSSCVDLEIYQPRIRFKPVEYAHISFMCHGLYRSFCT